MQRFLLLFLGLSLIALSCNKDDGLDLETNTIHLDGPNQSAPNLLTGSYEAAVRFTSDELNAYAGKDLLEVYFFLAALPADCTVKIYGPGTSVKPGALLYSATISSSLKAFDWNRHELRKPIAITGDDLWISIAFTHPATQQSIGCDPGPAAPDGDWLFQSSDNTWRTFRDRTRESINWNIRGRVSE